MEKTKAFIQTVRRYLVAASLAEGAFQWLVFCWAVFLIWSLVDFVLPLPVELRRAFYYCAAAAGLVILLRLLLRNRRLLRSDEKIIREIQRRLYGSSDELLSAWQLSGRQPPGVSAELVDALATKIERQVAHASCGDVLPLRAGFGPVVAAAGILFFITGSLYFLPPRLLQPSSARILGSLLRGQWNAYFAVVPGTRSLPRGTGVEIVLQRKRGFPGDPSLWVRADGQRWQRAELRPYSRDRYGFTVEQLTTVLDYRVSWGDWSTPVFSLTPVMFPVAGEFAVRYVYPSYTGIGERVVKGDPHLSGLIGTRVEIRARLNKTVREASLQTDDGGRYPALAGKDTITSQLIIKKTTRYRLLLTDDAGMTDPEPPVYDITVVPDLRPAVELLSPNEDLVVSQKSEVPLVLRAEDDFGLQKIELVYARGEKTVRVPVFSGTARGNRVYEYPWDLSKLELKPGEIVRYYIEALDNDTVAGPKSAVTPVLSIEVTDYEKEHEKIEGELKDLKGELVNLLADQTMDREQLRQLEVSFSTAACGGLLKAQRQVKSSTAKAVAHLDGILERMTRDPATDFATHSEYKALSSQLAYLRDAPMTDAVEALEKKDLAGTQKNQDKIIAALEKMTLLSEDIWQYQKMRDLLDKGDELEKTGRRLAEGKQPAELKKALQEVEELLAKIQRQIAQMPQELPEDFVNSPAVKHIDMRSTQGVADDLRRALEAGDWAKAKELASALSRRLTDMAKTLQGAGKDVGFSRSRSDDLKGELAGKKAELEQLVQRQENLLGRVGELDNERRAAMFRRQEGLLGQLETKQHELMAIAEKVRQPVAARLPLYGWNIGKSVELMRKVYEEFRQKRVYNSQKYLEDILRQWEDTRKGVEVQKAVFGQEYGKVTVDEEVVASGEKEVLDALRRQPDKSLFGAKDEERLGALNKEQGSLKESTKKLKTSLEKFTRKSASVRPEVSENLEKAAGKMDDTSDALAQKETPGAMESGRQALEYLNKGMQGMASSLDGMGEEGQGAGKPVSSPIQVRSPGGSGMNGLNNAPVRLPRADEYRPSARFRQEIMDALREKYPLQYEKMIKEYYRRLTE
jgi:hypothetical protein